MANRNVLINEEKILTHNLYSYWGQDFSASNNWLQKYAENRVWQSPHLVQVHSQANSDSLFTYSLSTIHYKLNITLDSLRW